MSGHRSPPPLVGRLLGWCAIASAWAAYAPLGLKYVAALGAAALALFVVRWRDAAAHPAALPALALLLLLAVSAAWTPAPWPEVGSHLWFYGLPLLVPLLATVLPAEAAGRSLRHFVIASAIAGVILIADHAGVLPPHPWLWRSTADVSGNQRIANSILLALAAPLAVWLAARPQQPPARRAGWLACAGLVGAALLLQDRRSGMLVLPLLVLAWAWVRRPRARDRALLAAAVATTAVLAWAALDGVRARFDEGWRELQADVPAERVDSSWGQRLHMLRLTAQMVRERPLTGHGIGSWRTLWLARTPPGSALAANSTPHSELLLVPQQAGLLALLAAVVLVVRALRDAARRGDAGVPGLLVWTALASAGCFNAVLRDGKFAVPLLVLAALAAAAAREPAPRSGGR